MAALPRIIQLVALIVILVGAAFIAFLFSFPPVEVVLGKPVPVRWGQNISAVDPLIQTLTVGRYFSLVEQDGELKLYLFTLDGLQIIKIGSGQRVVAAQIEFVPVTGKVQFNFSTLTYRTYSADELTKLLHFFQPIVVELDQGSGSKIIFPYRE